MKKDIASIVFMLVLAGFGIACTIDVSESMIRLPQDILGSTGFPRLVGALLALVALIQAGKILICGEEKGTANQLTKKSWSLIAVSSGFILGISYLGFAVSTLVYLFFTAAIFCDFKRERFKGISIYALAVTAVAFTFFKFFKVYLPDTILF